VFSGSTYSLVTVAVGSASNTIVSSGGEVLIEAGGNTTGTVLLGATTSFSFGGSEYVQSGATATGTTVNTSSTEYLYGGTTTGTMVHSGGAQVIVSGTALNDVVSAGGGVADSGTLAYTEAAGTSSSFVATLTGSGALVQSGPGTLALAGTLGNFSGTELISGGTLELTSATAGGNTSASITFTPGTRARCAWTAPPHPPIPSPASPTAT
jgi:fibronectin-binding autotransporter adhesin